jgi:asparagine synthase (glutamine-hydrolysing)
MCGIAGWFGPNADWQVQEFLAALRHRGPDGSGVWQSANATLVHTRLSIIDLSEAGAQPMGFESKIGGRRSEERDQLITDHSTAPHPNGDKSACPEVPPYRPPPAANSSTDHSSSHSPTANRQLTTRLSSPKSTDNSSSFSFVLVFNGEIYNYRELRGELEAAGEVFTSGSDTEVLLRLLVREGAACLPKLAGMFAFAFWDKEAGTALLARDQLGIKPLYYRDENGTLSFASETRVLRKNGDPTDASALHDFFLWGSVPEPATLNAAVRQLPAGHWLRCKDGKVEIARWHSDGVGRDRRARPFESAAAAPPQADQVGRPGGPSLPVDPAVLTRDALLESFRRHLVSDVPVGIFLSGGIDSTVILALTREVLGPAADIRTFSIGFDDPAFDESGLARRTAEHFGATHTEWRMTSEEGTAEIPAFLAAVDQPTIDGFNTWCVSKMARREGVKVVLSGLGGDEIFAGYGSFDRVPRFHAWHRRLGPLRRLAAAILTRQAPATPWRRLGGFFSGGGSWLEAYHAQRGIFTADEAARLANTLCGVTPAAPDWNVSGLSTDPAAVMAGMPFRGVRDHATNMHGVESSSHVPSIGPVLAENGSCHPDPREIVSHLEITRYMRNQLLRDSDVFSMAHGLELRVPFVDSRLLDTLASIPSAVRLAQGKQLLLTAVPELPVWIRTQPKRGFRFPFQTWLEGQFGELLVEAQKVSPVPLKAWYRTWAVAVAMRAIS